MGQAKQRGSFEQRKAEAIVRNAEEERERLARHERVKAEREAARKEREASMTKSERRSRAGVNKVLLASAALAATTTNRTDDNAWDI